MPIIYKEDLNYYIRGTKLYYLPPLYCSKIEITPTNGNSVELNLNNQVYSFVNRPISGSKSGIFSNYNIVKTLGYRYVFGNNHTTESNAFTVRYLDSNNAYMDYTVTVIGSEINYFSFNNTDFKSFVQCQAYTVEGVSTFSIASNSFIEYDLPYSIDNMYKLKVTYSVENPQTGLPTYLYNEYDIAVNNKIQFFYNSSEDNRVDKNNYLRQAFECYGNLRDSSSIVNPTLLIENQSVITANYCYIPNFGRYYYIDDIVSVRTNMWELSLRVDPLMSFKDKILELDCKINRQEFNYNPDLIDHEQLVEVEPIIEEIVSDSYNDFIDINSKQDNVIFQIVVSTSSYRYNEKALNRSQISWATAPTSNYFLLNSDSLMSFSWSLYNTVPEGDQPFVEPSECLRSVRVYPFDVYRKIANSDKSSQSVINIGKTVMLLPEFPITTFPPNYFNYNVPTIDSISSIIIDGGRLFIPKKYNNFLDFEPYTIIELYIPFIGWVKLPTNLVNGKEIHSKYIVDLETGTAINEIRIDSYTGMLILTTECDVGYDIPIVRMNTTDQMKRERIANIKSALRWVKTATDIASTVTKAGAGIAKNFAGLAKSGVSKSSVNAFRKTRTAIETESAGGIISSIANTIGENKIDKINAMQYNATSGQAGDSVLANCTVGLKLIARIYHPNPIDVPNYNHLVGRPSDYSGQLKNLQGYTEVGACHMEGFDTATPSEVTEIENEIKTGVIL